MTSLGEVLELIHSSRQRFTTARASGRTGDSRWQFWWAGDDRYRFERTRGEGRSVAVRAGAVWWLVDPKEKATTNDGDPKVGLGMPSEFGLLHTRSLLAAALLEVLRDAQIAGRSAAVVRATPRPGSQHWRWWGFEEGGDPTDISIDLERGVALSHGSVRVEEISFDQELAPGLFERPDGEGPVERADLHPREMSLEAARATVAFPVRVPRVLPEGARLLRCLVDPLDPPRWVGLSWAIDPGHGYSLNIRQGPAVAKQAERFQGDEASAQGVRLLVEGWHPQRLYRTVLVEVEGGWSEVVSDLPLEMIVSVAASLAEA